MKAKIVCFCSPFCHQYFEQFLAQNRHSVNSRCVNKWVNGRMSHVEASMGPWQWAVTTSLSGAESDLSVEGGAEGLRWRWGGGPQSARSSEAGAWDLHRGNLNLWCQTLSCFLPIHPWAKGTQWSLSFVLDILTTSLNPPQLQSLGSQTCSLVEEMLEAVGLFG